MISWQKLPNESIKQYNAFRFYLDLGPTRTIAQVYQNKNPFFANRQTIYKWRDTFHWDERVEAYLTDSAAQNETKEEKTLHKIRQGVLEQAQLDYQKLHDAWQKMYDDLVVKIGDSDHPVKPSELKALIDARQHLDAFARKAVQLPSGYSQTKIAEDTQDGPTLLQDSTRLTKNYQDDELNDES